MKRFRSSLPFRPRKRLFTAYHERHHDDRIQHENTSWTIDSETGSVHQKEPLLQGSESETRNTTKFPLSREFQAARISSYNWSSSQGYWRISQTPLGQLLSHHYSALPRESQSSHTARPIRRRKPAQSRQPLGFPTATDLNIILEGEKLSNDQNLARPRISQSAPIRVAARRTTSADRNTLKSRTLQTSRPQSHKYFASRHFSRTNENFQVYGRMIQTLHTISFI